MEQSTNYNFNLPSRSDETSADIDLISDNFRTVDDVVKQVQDDVLKTPTNLVNGSAEGSLRGINTWPSEDDEADYKIGENAVTLGIETRAKGRCSFAEGYYTTANGYAQHVKGRYNIPDNDNKYADIVGNGYYNTIFDNKLSNAHTLDWDGNAWFAGDVYVGGTSQDDEDATKLSSVATDITQVKEKLDGIEEGANKTIVDSELSDTSTNPLQNKVVTEKINSANSTITSINSALDTKVTREVAVVGSDDENSAGWYKVADGTMPKTSNLSMMFLVHSTFLNKQYSGILQLDLYCASSGNTYCHQLGWLVRNGFDTNQVIVTIDGSNWEMYFNVSTSQYYRTFFEVMQKSSTKSSSLSNYTLYTDSDVETTEPTATCTSADLGVIKIIKENLDKKADIETGTCTLSASNGTVSNATYSIVGNMVTLNFNIATTGAGNVVVSGLPFTATKNQSGFASSTATFNITANQTSVSINSSNGNAEYCTVTYLK